MKEPFSAVAASIQMTDWNKEAKETDKLMSELQRRGIELPKDGSLWFDDLEEQSGTGVSIPRKAAIEN